MHQRQALAQATDQPNMKTVEHQQDIELGALGSLGITGEAQLVLLDERAIRRIARIQHHILSRSTCRLGAYKCVAGQCVASSNT